MHMSKVVCNYYTLHIREDNSGNTSIETSLRELMWISLNCIDKEKPIQTNACKVGDHRDHILVDRTAKCHPEISGEGIE